MERQQRGTNKDIPGERGETLTQRPGQQGPVLCIVLETWVLAPVPQHGSLLSPQLPPPSLRGSCPGDTLHSHSSLPESRKALSGIWVQMQDQRLSVVAGGPRGSQERQGGACRRQLGPGKGGSTELLKALSQEAVWGTR